MIMLRLYNWEFIYDRATARWVNDDHPADAEMLTTIGSGLEVSGYVGDPALVRATLLAQTLNATLSVTGEDAAAPEIDPTVAY